MALVWSLLAAAAGAWAGERLHIPAGALIGAMVGVAALKIASVPTWDIPAAGRFLVYAALGWMLGQTFTRDSLRVMASVWLPVVTVVVLFLLLAGALAFLLWRWGLLDPVTAFLAAAPGAIAQIGVLSAETGAQVPVVLSVHLLRVTSVILLAPIVVRVLQDGG